MALRKAHCCIFAFLPAKGVTAVLPALTQQLRLWRPRCHPARLLSDLPFMPPCRLSGRDRPAPLLQRRLLPVRKLLPIQPLDILPGHTPVSERAAGEVTETTCPAMPVVEAAADAALPVPLLDDAFGGSLLQLCSVPAAADTFI